jgi:hypothetical protein
MSQMPALNLAGLVQGGSGLMDIVKQLQAAQTAANKANEQRYQDILGQYDTLGKAGETRIQQNTEQAQAKSTQDLTARGLGNTTITSAASRGIASDAEASRQALQEQVASSKAKVMEAKTDQGPDMSLYSNLLQKAAANQGNHLGPGGRNLVTNMNWGTGGSYYVNPGSGSYTASGGAAQKSGTTTYGSGNPSGMTKQQYQDAWDAGEVD